MISRIETIDDLIIWLESITKLHTKNVAFEKLLDDWVSSIVQTGKVLLAMKSRFPDPFKQCYRCKAVYPETEEWFDYSGQGRTGLHAACKFCRNTYQKKHKRNQSKSRYSAEDQAAIDKFRAGSPAEESSIPDDYNPQE